MCKNQIEQDIWQQLQRASVDKHHEWRSPVLVTNGLISELNQWPEARTVILRAVNIDTKELTFYSDSRSPKVAQITANPHAILVFWSKRLNWQLRIRARITIETETSIIEKAWQKVKQSPSAGDYLSAQAPGEMLDADTSDLISTSNHHFAMLIAKVDCIDWLTLSRNGHQRACLDAQGITYLVP